jgi:hypothetical protein
MVPTDSNGVPTARSPYPSWLKSARTSGEVAWVLAATLGLATMVMAARRDSTARSAARRMVTIS